MRFTKTLKCALGAVVFCLAICFLSLCVFAPRELQAASTSGGSGTGIAPKTDASSLTTTATVGQCASGKGWCLKIAPPVGPKEIILSATGRSCASYVGMGDGTKPLQILGDPRKSKHVEAAAAYCEYAGQILRAAIAIVDLTTGALEAVTESPEKPGIVGSYTDYPRDPNGNRYPFLAPAFNDRMVGNAPLWGYMCLYRPDAKHTGRCGKDFLEISTAPKSIYGPFFRESGGYLEDLDGDGWEDITLIYHWMVYTISGRTGQPISLTEYDIAKATDPRYPGFHSGRNYGIHTVLTGPDGTVRTVMIGGAPVGQFGGPYAFCNVSRFVGVLASVTKAPAARKLAWSHYYGRNSTVFDLSKGYRPELAAHPPVVRPPDIQNGCIHRFSDGIATTGDARIVIFDAFRQTAPADLCTAEQYSYYAPGNDEKVWYACWDKNLKSRGTWTVQAFTLENGRSLFTQTNFYVWGMSNNLLPGREQVFLAEHLPAQLSFDLSDVTPSKLVVVTLSHGQWQMRGSFPIAGRPKIVLSYPGGPYGVDSASANRNGYAELVTRKNKESGLDEVELEDNSWVGYEQASGQFVRKTP